jgi:hypothetical protein
VNQFALFKLVMTYVPHTLTYGGEWDLDKGMFPQQYGEHSAGAAAEALEGAAPAIAAYAIDEISIMRGSPSGRSTA